MYTQADIRNPVHTGGPRSISKKAIRSFPEACRSFLQEPIPWLREDAHDSQKNAIRRECRKMCTMYQEPIRWTAEAPVSRSHTNPLDSGSGQQGRNIRSRQQTIRCHNRKPLRHSRQVAAEDNRQSDARIGSILRPRRPELNPEESRLVQSGDPSPMTEGTTFGRRRKK